MTGPEPLSDRDLDRLLAHDAVPPLRSGLTDRIVAEAGRADRVRAIASPAPRRTVRRPWRRRTMIGVIAINLFAASAIAAAISGHEGFRRLSTFSAHVLHSIAAAIPHRHRVEHPAPHHRPIVHPAAVARSAAAAPRPTTIAVPPAMPVPRRAFDPPEQRERSGRAIRAERRLERATERRVERRSARQERRLARRRAEGPPFGWNRREARAERRGRLVDRVGRAEGGGMGRAGLSGGAPTDTGARAATRDMPRDQSPVYDVPRSQPNADGPSDLRDRRQGRLARQEWRQRQGFGPWRRGGAGFRPHRWRR